MAKKSELMWAHYAKSHSGLCFCIDFAIMESEVETKGPYPVQVTYVNSLLDERTKSASDSSRLGLLIGATKGDVWAYEEEVRLVIESDSFDSSKFKKVDQGRNIDVVLDITHINKVVFGLKSSPQEIHSVVAAFALKGHRPVFTRLDLDPLTLEVVEKTLP